MVVCSWLVSLALSSPQAIMFRKVKHPNIDFCQCTSDLILEMHSEIIIKNGEPTFLFFGIDPEIIYSVYQFSFLFFVYFLPLFCIIISYVVIIRLMRRCKAYHEKNSTSTYLPFQTRFDKFSDWYLAKTARLNKESVEKPPNVSFTSYCLCSFLGTLCYTSELVSIDKSYKCTRRKKLKKKFFNFLCVSPAL